MNLTLQLGGRVLFFVATGFCAATVIPPNSYAADIRQPIECISRRSPEEAKRIPGIVNVDSPESQLVVADQKHNANY